MTRVFRAAEINFDLPSLADVKRATLRFAIREPKVATAAVATAIGFLADSDMVVKFAVFSLGSRVIESMMGYPEDQGLNLILGPFN